MQYGTWQICASFIRKNNAETFLIFTAKNAFSTYAVIWDKSCAHIHM